MKLTSLLVTLFLATASSAVGQTSREQSPLYVARHPWEQSPLQPAQSLWDLSPLRVAQTPNSQSPLYITQSAEDQSSLDVAAILRRLEATEQKLKDLEARQKSDVQELNTTVREVEKSAVKEAQGDYNAFYDKGFRIEGRDPKQTPFALKVNGRIQARYSGFRRENTTSATNATTNQGLAPIGVPTRNDFEVERGRLEFRGHFLEPQLKFYINLDADTDDNHLVIFHDFWFEYEFSESFGIRVGKAKVPGSYEWWESSTTTRFADRSVSTTFFRPDRSVGIWFDTQLSDDVYWQSSIVNGFNSTDLAPGDVDDVFTYSNLIWWDALGDIGKGFSDLAHHDEFALRIGGAYTYSNQNPDDGGGVLEEAADVGTFSDGSNITALGALAPGVQINDFDVHLLSGFFNFKYQGWSLNAEYYARWLQNFGTVSGAPAPLSEVYDDGFYIDVGHFVVPETLELIGRVSTIDGLFGDSWEYAAGVTWFLNGTHKHKITFDATILDGIPTGSSSPNFEVGQDGILYRLQYQAAF